ncbi:MAG: substrate-binding domain-containing protein [Aggregatilineales bacterium]
MWRARRTLVVVAFALASCSTPVPPASTPTTHTVVLRLYATSATLPLLNDLMRFYAQRAPEVSFDVRSASYASVVNLLLQEPDAYFLTNHLPSPETSALWGAPIGQDAIVIVAHPDVAIATAGLTLAELRDVYQGRITNWRALGGADQPIVVVSREDGSGTRAEFERLVMGERRTTRTALVAPSSAAMVEIVARQPGSLGYVSLGWFDSRLALLPVDGVLPTRQSVASNTYPLRTTLFIAGLGEPQGTLRTFIAWAQSPEGQAVVARRHAPLN